MTTAATTATKNASATPATRVYHVGRWRLFWAWAPFLAPAVGCAIAAVYADAPDARALLWMLAAFLTVLMSAMLWMVRRARLEIGAGGIMLRQIGLRLETPWSNVVGLRTNRGREGFTTAQPVTGKGMHTLAAAASVSAYGTYDEEQRGLLDRYRFIPIEAFAWHLRKGSLRDDIAAVAPHLASDLATLDHKPVRKPFDYRSFWLVVAIIGASLAFAAVMLVVDDRVQAMVFNIAYSLLAPAMAVSAGVATWQMIRRRSWLLTALMGAMTLVMVGWTLVQWGRLIG